MTKVNSNPDLARIENIVFQTEDGSKAVPVILVQQSGDTLQPGEGGGNGGGTTQEVTVQNWPSTQTVEVSNPTKTVGVGQILSGSVDPSGDDYPKLIVESEATAVEIQCPQDNTAPLLVSNMSMDFGDWEVYPGTSKVFYYNTLYVRVPGDTGDTQKVTFMATAE